MATMGLRAYARHRGVTLGAVQKAIRSGRINVDGDNKIDSEQADRAWAVNTDASRVAMISETDQPALPLMPMASDARRVQPEDAHDDLDDEETGEKGNLDPHLSQYREHRAKRERYQALKQQLEYEQQVGNLIDVNEARRIVFTSFRALRDSILNIAPRIKDELVAIDDSSQVEQILERELGAALAGIDVKQLLEEHESEE